MCSSLLTNRGASVSGGFSLVVLPQKWRLLTPAALSSCLISLPGRTCATPNCLNDAPDNSICVFAGDSGHDLGTSVACRQRRSTQSHTSDSETADSPAPAILSRPQSSCINFCEDYPKIIGTSENFYMATLHTRVLNPQCPAPASGASCQA